MKAYFDLHSHLLCGVDDGAKDETEMMTMLDMAYQDGIRGICLTPHFSPYLYGDTSEASQKAYETLCSYAKEKYPDLSLCLGHELGYHDGCVEALKEGSCRTLANSRYVLVDFPEGISFFELKNAMNRLQPLGYRPILAHTERYRCLVRKLDWIREFEENGGIVQINASSIGGEWGRIAKWQWKRLLKKRLVHLIATDAHHTDRRKPQISVCMEYLRRTLPESEIEDLMWNNAEQIVHNQSL